MSMKEDAIRNSVAVAEEVGGETAKAVGTAIDGLNNPNYRVAVVGRFQVGKTTLINRVFLGDKPVLVEGGGLCTTSTLTEVAYGPNFQMEVWNNSPDGKEVLAETKDNPTEADVRAATVANDEEDRLAVSKRVAKVRITAPNEGLRKYTIEDTPGLDDPIPELLLNTTYKVIPQCDLAVVVSECTSLGELEKALIDSLGKSGVSKVLVLLSYFPNGKHAHSVHDRKAIKENVQGTLAGMGIPKDNVAVYCYDESVSDVLNTPAKIGKVIGDFLDANARSGREAKVAFAVREAFLGALLEIATKIKVAKISENDRQMMLGKLEKKERDCYDKTEQVLGEMGTEFCRVNESLLLKADNKIDLFFDRTIGELEAASDLAAAKAVIEKLDRTLRQELNKVCEEISDNTKKEISAVIERHSERIAEVDGYMHEFVADEIDIGGKMWYLHKIPAVIAKLVDILVVDYFFPGGFLMAIFGEFIRQKLPLIGGFGTGDLLKKLVETKGKSALEEYRVNIKDGIRTKLKENINALMDNLSEAMRNKQEEQFAAIRRGIAETSDADAANLQKLEALRDRVKAAVDSLA